MEEDTGSLVVEEVTDVVEVIDYTELLETINENLNSIKELLSNHFEITENFHNGIESYFGSVDGFFDLLSRLEEYSGYIAGFILFAVVVLLCYFAYKFFRMFF